MHLRHTMIITAFIFAAAGGFYIFHKYLGSFATILGSIIALGALSFIGWILIDKTY